MEITLLSEAAIKIKSKTASLLIDPVAVKTKLAAEAVLLTKKQKIPEVENMRLAISGPGEYEVGGIKITGTKAGEGNVYFLTVDGISIFVGSTSAIKKETTEAQMAILLADGLVDQSALANGVSSVALFYGEKAAENVKALGKEVAPTEKFVITKDKLSAEMEVVLLQ